MGHDHIKVVLVTGASGYIGAETVKQLLDRGYIARAVLRSAIKEVNTGFEALAAALPGSLELVYVPDIVTAGAYDDAVRGVDYVLHLASPVVHSTGSIDTDQTEVVDPAVKGATNILQSVAKYAKDTVKRVVLTSSGAALTPRGATPGEKVYNEKDWNTSDTIESSVYHFSKVQAELAAWKLAKEHGIDLVTILPTLVLGPVTINRPNRTGISVDSVKTVLEGGSWSAISTQRQIDVRDVALAHIRAFEIPSASGRYILSHEYAVNPREVQEALQAEFPDVALQEAQDCKPIRLIDSSRSQKELQLNLIPSTRSVVDQARTLIQLGIAKPKMVTQ